MKTKILRSLSLICTLLLLIPALSITAFAANTVTPIANYVTVTDSLSNGSLSNGTVTITAKGGQFVGQTNKITIQNISSSKCKITFDYTANHYGSFSEGSAEGTVTTILDGGGKYAMSITGVKALFADPATLTLRNFTCVEIYEGPITVTHNTLGTVTVNGTTVPNGGTSATITAEGAELIATPVNGASFVAWVNTNNNEVLSHKANFTLIPYATTMNISAIFTTADQVPYCKIGNTLYADLEDAINVAVSGNQKTVAIISNSTLPTGTITIPNGVSLLLPYAGENTEIMSSTTIVEGGWKSTFEHANTTLISGHTHGNDAIANVLLPNKEVTYTLTIPADTTLNVESGGKFVIGGTITSGHQSTAGILCATAGAHSNVIVDGTINVNGILSTCGYVLGAGTINVPTEGTIYQPFTFMNHQAGTYVVASSDSESYWPFTRYAMLNIQCDIHMEPGSNMKGYADIYTSKTSVTKMGLTVEVAERHNVDCVNIIGSSGSMINTSGTVDISYDPNRYVNDTEHNAVGLYNRIGTTTLDISGGASLGNFALTVSVASMEQTFDTANNYFPIPYNYVFNLRNGDYAIDYKIKLMPGAKMYVASDANLSVNGGLAIMDGFRDHASSTETIGLGDWYAFHYPSAAVLQASPLNSNGTANLIVDGNLTVTGTLVGLIQTNGTGTVSMNGNNTLDLHVGAKNTTNLMGLLDTTITGKSVHSLTAQLFNPNGERFTMENGKTYVAANAETHVIPEFSYKVYTTYNDDSKIESNTIALNAETIGSWACKEGTHSNAAAVRENEQPASCTADGSYDSVVYCTACHTEISRTTETIPQLSHKWTDATCTAPKTCSVCGATEGAALGHSWTDATCTTPRTCSVCGATEGEALGHTWVAANCTTPKTCSVCKATEGAALGHTWADADCDTPKTCSVCGATDGAALGHKWTDANCTAPKTCSVCGETEGEALGHEWADADCDTPKTCSVCGATEGEALGHKWTDANCTAPKTCSVCGATEGEALSHTYGDPSMVWEGTKLTVTLTCGVCAEGTEDRVLTGFAEGTEESSTTGDCKTHSTTTYTATVTLNGKDYSDETTITGEYGDHTYGDLIEELPAVHTKEELKAGVAAHYQCSVCKGYFDAEKKQTSIESLTGKTPEHTPAEAVIENKKDATCGEAGSYDSVVYCSVEGCGKELSRENKNIDATGKHTGGEATCKTKAVCTVCQQPYGEIDSGNHKNTELRGKQEATEFEPGYTGDTYCTDCNTKIADGGVIPATHQHSFGEEWTSDATGHWHECACKDTKDFAQHIPGDAATEEAAQTCIECGYEIAPKLEHVHVLTKVEAAEATCVANGNIEHYKCSGCEQLFSDVNGKNAVTDIVIPATGHSYGEPEWSWTGSDENGYTAATAEFICEKCDDPQTIEATVSSDTTDATATTDGQTVYTATVHFKEATHTDSKTVTIPAIGEPEIELIDPFGTITMELNNRLTFCFLVYPESLPTDCYAEITRTGVDGTVNVKIPYNQWTEYTKGRKKISFDKMAAMQMTDEIQVIIYSNQGKQLTVAKTSSVREFAMGDIQKAETIPSLKGYVTMLVDMLNYGAAAQIQFNYREDDLANNQLTESQQAFSTQDVKAVDGLVKGTAYSTTTMSLENNIILNLIFFNDELGGNLDDLTARITYTHEYAPEDDIQTEISGRDFKEYTSKNGRKRCMVEVSCLNIPDGEQIVKCEILNAQGEVVGSVEESFSGYSYRVVNLGVTDKIYPAIVKFSASAKAYFESQR